MGNVNLRQIKLLSLCGTVAEVVWKKKACKIWLTVPEREASRPQHDDLTSTFNRKIEYTLERDEDRSKQRIPN